MTEKLPQDCAKAIKAAVEITDDRTGFVAQVETVTFKGVVKEVTVIRPSLERRRAGIGLTPEQRAELDTAPIATAIRELPLTIGRLTELLGFVVNYANDLSKIDRFSEDLGHTQEHLIDAFIASERVRFVGRGES